jgi:hypothetical protein
MQLSQLMSQLKAIPLFSALPSNQIIVVEATTRYLWHLAIKEEDKF